MTSPSQISAEINTPDIVMDWNGSEETAALIVDGIAIRGRPEDVRAVFDAINDLRNRRNTLLGRVLDALEHISKADEALWL